MINIDLVPNFQKDDIEIIKKILGGYEDLLSKKRVLNFFKAYFPQGEILFFNSARGALTFLLNTLKRFSSRRSILTQAFSCLVVPNAIKFAGLKPIYVDIDNSFNFDLQDLKNKITSDTLAIIIQNTFGLPAEIEKILEIAKEKNVLIIENLTHSLGAKYKSVYLGNFGDFALLSFNRNKVISSIIGGALVINNEIYKNELINDYQKIPEMTKNQVKKIVLGSLFLIYGKKYYHYGVTKFVLRILREFGLTPEMIKDEEKRGLIPQNYLLKFPFHLFPLLENQLKKLESFNNHRQKIAQIYIEAGLKDFEINENSEPNFLRFPVFSEKKDETLEKFKKEKIYLGDWYKCVLAPCPQDLSVFDYEIGSCPRAEDFAKRILNLPTSIDVNEKDAFKIAELFKKWK